MDDDPVLLNENLLINAFDFGPDGYLYAPSFFAGEVLKVDVDAAVVEAGVAVSNGSIYVSDDGVNKVYEFRMPRVSRRGLVDAVQAAAVATGGCRATGSYAGESQPWSGFRHLSRDR